MNRSNDLLNLEKKLEAHNIQERITNKFLLKPDMTKPNTITTNPSLMGNLNSFLDQFKKSNELLLSDSTKVAEMNIEDSENRKNAKNGLIKMVSLIYKPLANFLLIIFNRI